MTEIEPDVAQQRLIPAAETNATTGTLPADPERACRILLVNDNAADLIALKSVLQEPDVEVVAVCSSRDALRALLHESFDLLLLDVNMPGMDGFQMATLIRTRARLREVPIVFVTATSADSVHQAYGLKLGAVDYIFTPVSPEILRGKVNALLEMRRQARRQRQLERSEHERQLSEVRRSLEEEVRRNRFFTLSIDLLAVMGADGVMLHVSPSWEGSLGYTAQEMVGRQYLDFIVEQDVESTRSAFASLGAGQPLVGFENRGRCKDGSFRWLLWNSAPFPEQELIYAAATDITGRKQAEQALAEREAMLQAANKELEAFAYSASHDLRAPLRTIRGFADILREDYAKTLDAEALHHMERISRAAHRMSELIEALLKLTQVGRSDIRRETLDLAALAEAIIGELREREPQRRVAVAIPAQITARADPNLLPIVLDNLLGNAWKFTGRNPEARIEMTIEENGGERIYRICDNGVGFDAAHAAKVFNAFQRLHSVEDFPGTGLGLATVQRIVQRHGGRVWATAAPGKGATIAFTLGEQDRSGPAGVTRDTGGSGAP